MYSVKALASVVREARVGVVKYLGNFDAKVFSGCGNSGVFVW